MRIRLLILFLVLNFGALALGSIFTNSGVVSDWYISLNKAPWTPPGWVFGAAWTFIMLCFSFYMANIFKFTAQKRRIVFLYVMQWIFNVSWNMIFFKYHFTATALACISLLFILTVIFLVIGIRQKKAVQVMLILPYVIWLMIAVSLNAYIVANN